MSFTQFSNGDSMRVKQGSNPSSNSAAIPLPTAFWDPEFRCRPFAQLLSKWLIYLMLPTWRGSLLGAAARFVPELRDKRTGSAAADPCHASSGCRAVGWGLRVGPQAGDEIGEAELPCAPQPFRGDDGLDLRDALLDLAVDDHVLVFRPVTRLLGRLRHPSGDDGGTVLGTIAQPCLERGAARRQYEDRNEIAANALGQLLGSLPVEIADDVPPGNERLLDRPPRRPVAISEDGRMLQERALRNHLVKAAAIEENVVPTLDLALAPRPCRH